jgi:flagellar capping protein FliD
MRGQLEIDSELLALKESIKRSDNKIETLTKEMDSKNEEIEKVFNIFFFFLYFKIFFNLFNN